MVFLILIHIFKVKFLRRISEAHAQETVNLRHHRFLFSLHVSSASDCLTKFFRTQAQSGIQKGVHRSCIATLIRLLHCTLRNNPVLFHKVDKHIPLSSVSYAFRENVAYSPVVHRAVRQINDALQHVICLFKLVPECRIVLRKLKFIQITFLRCYFSQHIQCRENPAPSAGFLIRHRKRRNINRKRIL